MIVEYRHTFSLYKRTEEAECYTNFDERQMVTKEGTKVIESIVILIAFVIAVVGSIYSVLCGAISLAVGG